MKNLNVLMLLTLTAFSTQALSYGGGGSSKKCAKPKFSQFTPAHLSDVSSQSEFSFVTSASTNSSSIKVTVKKQAVDVTINKTNSGYFITGKLPESLNNTYARIAIQAKGTNNCAGGDGWLLKISD